MGVDAFVSPTSYSLPATSIASRFVAAPFSASSSSSPRATRRLHMALDPVTYLRTEWVSAALVTNQTPRDADSVLELGCEDGRIVNFVPRTVREIITSSAEDLNSPEGGRLSISCSRQLRQQAERRGSGSLITFSDQRADDLADTPTASVDIVVSLQAAQRMAENGLDWKRGVREAGRVLKPGGRFLFVESSEVGSDSYLEYIVSLSDFSSKNRGESDDEDEDGEKNEMMEIMNNADTNNSDEDDESIEVEPSTRAPLFQEVGYDQVDMVLQPHIAGIAIKALDADLSKAEKAEKKVQEESDRLAELSLNAFERGSRRRKKKKKKNKAGMGMDNDKES